MIPLSEMLAYNRWANRQYLDVIATLDAGQFTRQLGGSFGSVRDTLVHLAWAEWLWVKRWQNTSPQVRVTPGEFPTVESVRAYLEDVEQGQTRIFEGENPDIRTVRIRYTNLKKQVWEYSLEEMVQHVVMHSAYHRGQLATLLRQLNVIPPTTDYLIYLDVRKSAGE
jgi:uncharacterized damage-inducible protein DinB